MNVEVYDSPPSREYVKLAKAELLKMRKHLLKLLKIVIILRKKLGDGFLLGITFTRRSLDRNL